MQICTFLVASGLVSRYGPSIAKYLDGNPSALPRSLPAVSEPPMTYRRSARNRLDSRALEALVTAQSSVVAIEVLNGTETTRCSGVFVSEREIATAGYCLSTAMSAGGSGAPADQYLLGRRSRPEILHGGESRVQRRVVPRQDRAHSCG